jgi:hypothetical protein
MQRGLRGLSQSLAKLQPGAANQVFQLLMVAYDLWSTREVHRAELCPGAFLHLPTDQWTPRQHSRLAALRQMGAVPGALSISFSLVRVPFPLRLPVFALTPSRTANELFYRDRWRVGVLAGSKRA